ncbi:hypothetical protein [Rhodovarius lipocyclicus]|uniref:hypothetical protein n=1 Tax=Rhodovarius lipocyclicus TaxID=268410 RepID=UPI0013591111|nr:hypothetical protein [Rhodovarius lipocyclicus]
MSDTTEADFQALLRIAGISFTEDRYPVMLDAYRSWLKLVEVLDEPLPLAVEPAAAPRLAEFRLEEPRA